MFECITHKSHLRSNSRSWHPCDGFTMWKLQ